MPPEVTVTVYRETDGDRLHVAVSDNGPGIPETERETIESGEETALSHSLGIDLWLMKWIATSLGGELAIDDNEPRGTVMTFRFPAGR